MKCPHCLHESKGLVLETRTREGDTLRRRACGHCGRTFVTCEYTDATLVIPRLLKKEPKQRTAKVTSNALFSAWN
jgi:transcriptional regulator NrdR family protein